MLMGAAGIHHRAAPFDVDMQSGSHKAIRTGRYSNAVGCSRRAEITKWSLPPFTANYIEGKERTLLTSHECCRLWE